MRTRLVKYALLHYLRLRDVPDDTLERLVQEFISIGSAEAALLFSSKYIQQVVAALIDRKVKTALPGICKRIKRNVIVLCAYFSGQPYDFSFDFFNSQHRALEHTTAIRLTALPISEWNRINFPCLIPSPNRPQPKRTEPAPARRSTSLPCTASIPKSRRMPWPS